MLFFVFLFFFLVTYFSAIAFFLRGCEIEKKFTIYILFYFLYVFVARMDGNFFVDSFRYTVCLSCTACR